jgi:predicted PurR-regulated permease PerM
MPTSSIQLVPGWLVTAAAVGWRLLVTIGIVLVALVVAYTIPVSTTATLVSLVFAATLAPTAMRLRARGLSRPRGAARTVGAGGALVIGVVVILVVILIPDLKAIAAAVGDGITDLRTSLMALGPPAIMTQVIDRLADSVRSALAPDVAALVGSLADVGTVLVLGTFLTYFLLADGDRGWRWAMGSMQAWQAEAVMDSAMTGLVRVAWYMRRTALLAVLDAAVVFVVLGLFGVPLAGSLAAVAFVAGFVPYLGAVAGGAIVGLAALAFGGPVPAVVVLIALLGSWILATRLLAGTALGGGSDLNPVLVLVAIPAGLALFGLLGLIALLPVTVFALAVWRSVISALERAPAAHPAAGADDDAAAAEAEASELPAGVPLWLERVAQWSWRGLVLAGLAWLVISLVVRVPQVVVPTLIAVVFAATLLPVVDRLERRGWGRGLASAVSTAAVIVFVVVSIGAAIGLTIGPMQQVVQAAAEGASDLDLDWLKDAILDAGSGVQLDVSALLTGTAGVMIGVLLSVLMAFFFLRDGRRWWRSAIARLADGRRGPVGEAGRRATDVLAGYMVGTAAISAFGGITSGLIMVVLGLPLAVPITVIGFFAGFIPYIGSFITTALALMVTVAFGTTTDVVVMLIFTVIFNIAQGNFVTPIVYGRSLSLHPAIVLMAIPVGNEVAGVLGMFLVVPAAAMVAATWRLLPAAIDAAGVPPPAGEPHEADGAPAPAEAAPPADAASPAPAGT